MGLFGKSKMKLGVSYNLYDGEEHLAASARAIRSEAEHITVIYQNVSNFGERREDDLAVMLEDLRRKGIIDSYVKYDPDLNQKPWGNEHRKRVMGVERCNRAGCNYHLNLDVDEYYVAEQVRKAKEFILANGIENSAVPCFYYLKSPRYRVEGAEYAFPFIFKSTGRIEPKGCAWFPCRVDGTRILKSGGKFYQFNHTEIAMHHMAGIRKDMDRKFRNSTIMACSDGDRAVARAAQKRMTDYVFGGHPIPAGYDFLDGKLIRLVEDRFGIGEMMQ